MVCHGDRARRRSHHGLLRARPSGGTSRTVEIYDLKNAGAGWTTATRSLHAAALPAMALLPNGKVFYTGQGAARQRERLDLRPCERGLDHFGRDDEEPGLRLRRPPAAPAPELHPRVMTFGGGDPAKASTEIIDLSAASPSWTPGPNMSTGRIQMNAVILPNGKVLAEGGSVNNESPEHAGENGRPLQSSHQHFSSAGTAAYSRLYHSVALLLPDATVASMGSNPGPGEATSRRSRSTPRPICSMRTTPDHHGSSEHHQHLRRSGSRSATASPFSVSYTSARRSAPRCSCVPAPPPTPSTWSSG